MSLYMYNTLQYVESDILKGQTRLMWQLTISIKNKVSKRKMNYLVINQEIIKKRFEKSPLFSDKGFLSHLINL